MNPLSVREILRIVGGTPWIPFTGEGPLVHHVCTDSRAMKAQSLFVAIKGQRFDGHDKLADAAAGGAIAALVQRVPDGAPANLQLILVKNSRQAMGTLATHIRRQLRCPMIAVGGSNGKTSTKYLIHSVLSTKLRGSISPKSFNNDIGVPLAIFPADPEQDYLVLEIGTNHPGEVRALSEMAQPDIAVITCVAAEHLEALGDIDGVRREEADLVVGMNPTGTLIVNGDDEKFIEMVHYDGDRITFGLHQRNDLFAADIACDELGVRFRLNGERRIFVPLLGKHVASNALAAIAVGRKFKLSDDEIILALAQARGPEMRLQIQKMNGLTLLNDAYNANPASFQAALETVCALPTAGRRVAIVGDMRELGLHSERYHREAGALAGKCRLDLLICVGENAPLIADAAREAGMAATAIRQYSDVATAAKAVPRTLKNGDLVLFKASRGLELEKVIRAVQIEDPSHE